MDIKICKMSSLQDSSDLFFPQKAEMFGTLVTKFHHLIAWKNRKSYRVQMYPFVTTGLKLFFYVPWLMKAEWWIFLASSPITLSFSPCHNQKIINYASSLNQNKFLVVLSLSFMRFEQETSLVLDKLKFELQGQQLRNRVR